MSKAGNNDFQLRCDGVALELESIRKVLLEAAGSWKQSAMVNREGSQM
jgi:hypothetical protein